MKGEANFLTSGTISYGKLIWDNDNGYSDPIDFPSWMQVKDVNVHDAESYLVIDSWYSKGTAFHCG